MTDVPAIIIVLAALMLSSHVLRVLGALAARPLMQRIERRIAAETEPDNRGALQSMLIPFGHWGLVPLAGFLGLLLAVAAPLASLFPRWSTKELDTADRKAIAEARSANPYFDAEVMTSGRAADIEPLMIGATLCFYPTATVALGIIVLPLVLVGLLIAALILVGRWLVGRPTTAVLALLSRSRAAQLLAILPYPHR